jgi:hypothetical protein
MRLIFIELGYVGFEKDFLGFLTTLHDNFLTHRKDRKFHIETHRFKR